MKRYLLIIMMMVCAVTGAWATPTSFGTASTYEVSDGVLTLTIGAASDVTNTDNYSILDGLKSGIKRVKIVTDGSVILSSGGGGPLATLNALYSSSVSILDLSEAAVTYSTTWDGVTSLGMADGSNNTFENFIVPSSYSSNPGDFKVSNMYNAGSIATTNNFTIESSTVVAGVINKADKAIGTNLTSFSSSATTLKILNEIETTDLTSVLSSGQILDLTNVTTTGNTSTNPITVASGVKVVCLSEGVAARVKGTSDVYNLDIKCTAAELQSKLDALSSAGFTPTSITITSASAALTQDDLDRLNTAVERINLEDATFASGVTINNLTLHSSLKGLTLPKGSTIDPTLKASAASSNLEYIYVPTTETQTQAGQLSVADYVWVVRPGGLARAMKNEATLRTAVYVKVASDVANSVALNNDDAKFGSAGIDASAENDYPWQYVDLSGTIVTVEATLAATAPHNKSYRIILPDNLTGDNMAIFASNPNHGKVAAVYSYNSTKLTIMEIVDDSYKPAALADPRIMRSTTTEVDVVSGYYNGNTYAQFGDNLLEALNNMGNSSYEYVPGHANTAGLNVRTISIKTTSAAPNALTFTNPLITTLKVEGLLQTSAALNVNACNALTTLSLKGSNLNSVTAQNTHITSADLSATAISTTTNFNGATALATFTTTNESVFNGDLDLTSSALTTFNSSARFGGNLKLNASNKLTSVDVGEAIFTNNSSVIHVDDATGESSTVISNLQGTDKITVPASFKDNVSDRVHPYNASYVKVAPAIADAYTATSTNMVFHDKETTEGTPDKYRYWYYDETTDADGIVTVGTTSTRTLHDVIKDNSVLTSDTHAKIKVVGPLTQHSVDSLKYLNATTLDLSEATSGVSGTTIGQLLKTCFSNTSTLGVHSNVKFIQLPDTCSRDHILNATALDGLKESVYCVLAINDTGQGKDLTSYSFVSGALQPAVIMADNNNSDSWQKKPDNETTAKLYSSSVSTFKKLKISGLINSYDLSKGDQKLDADGHLSWKEEPVETSSQTRTLNGGYVVYGPFSACHNLTEIDLRDAYFEEKGDNTGLDDYHKRYWFSDMTLSALNVISTATYKVVVPQDSRVHEIPADFMNCSTYIRAICIPSNIQAIRTRAFYTIDYVWTTADAYATESSTNDPEGNNTRLDNGAKLKDGTQVYAMKYDTGKHKYEENPDFSNSYYTADYSGVDGGGTYTFGSTLKLIETGAFANAQPHVKDVYVLNTKAPECHVDAFNTVMYTGNGGYSSISGDQKIISRENYFNNGFWITMLHYPRQTTTPELQRYTDPTREYSIATGERDGKGATLYFPNQSEFIRAYQQGTYGYIWNAWNPTREYGSVSNGTLLSTTSGWTEDNQTTANGLFDAYASGENHQYTSFYKVDNFEGKTVTAPTAAITPYYNVYWSDAAYNYSSSVATGYSKLYIQSELSTKYDGTGIDNDNSGEQTSKDYRGWHQFVLNAYAANTVLKEEPYRSYITDNDWWTICMPFSLTRAEAIQIFGTPAQEAVGDNPAVAEKLPYVSRLLYVIRNLNTANISLCFSKNLMTNSEGLGKLSSENKKQHGVLDGNGVVTIAEGTAPDAGDIVMAAGVPYLIKPNMPMSGSSAVNRQFRIYTTEDYGKLTPEQKNATSPKAICNDSLYARIQASQRLSGADQIDLVEDGICKVPVFMTTTKDDRVSDESHVEGSPNDPTYTINSTEYYKSTAWYYAFVGTFFKSFMPQYSYYLGWNNTLGKAQFFYKTSAKENVMTWINETGVIVPTAGAAFSKEITPAKGQVPAQWEITGSNDYFTINNGDGSKQQAKGYGMLLDADNVTIVTGVETPEVAVPEVIADGNGAVYNISGQKVDASRNALPKGIYIQNGKKYVVK